MGLGRAIPGGEASLLLCFSHLRWSFVYQRPQHLMARAARGQRVVFFEEPLFEGNLRPYLRVRDDDRDNVTIAEPVFPENWPVATSPTLRALLDDLILDLGQDPDILWYYTPMALEFSSHLKARVSVYDNMDELSAFRGAPPRLLELEQEMFCRADLVFTGGHSLFEAKRHRHNNIHPFPSSVDINHFMQSRYLKAEPPDQAPLRHPRFGFFGVIDERMDLGLVGDIARSRPHWQLVMIGPVAKIDPAALPRAPNIAWLGMKPYSELPSYLAGWDVGIMPFAQNESTRYISPTKTPEFLASGTPLVSTPIADVVNPYAKLGLVKIANDAQSFIAACEVLLSLNKSEWLPRVDHYLAGNTWDATWSAMESLIMKAQSASQSSVGGSRARGVMHV